MLNALYIRGRHSSQKFNKEIQTMVEELSALLIKKNFLDDKHIHNAKNTLLEIYEKATEERFSFLFVNLMKSNINDGFV